MDKPFKTIDEQIAILEVRGVLCGPETAGILEREGYYPVINGYKAPFLDLKQNSPSQDDVYAPGTSFADIYRLFEFDRDLRNMLMGYLNKAEASLKTVSAYRFGMEHRNAPEAYLDIRSYRLDRAYRGRVERLVNEFKKILNKDPYQDYGFKREYIEHYELNHDNTPIWIVMNFLMLGQAFKFFEYQPETVRNAIAHSFSDMYAETHDTHKKISPRRLRLAYDHIKDFRNICAHDERLFCARVSPSRDVRMVDMLADLELVLTSGDFKNLRRSILNLVFELQDDLDADKAARVLNMMGVQSVRETFPRSIFEP